MKMMREATAMKFRSFKNDTKGATAIEYAMIASGIGAFVAATVWSLGGQVKTFFTSLAGML